MNARTESRLPASIRRVLSSYKRRSRAVRAVGGLFFTAGIVGAAAGLAAAADRLFRLGAPVRMILFAALVLTCLSLLARAVLVPIIRRVGDRRAAARVGHSFPETEEDLVSAVELSTQDEQGVSHALVDSALSKIAARTSAVDYRAAVPFRPLVRTALLFAVILGILQAAFFLSPKAVGNALHRLFSWDQPYYLATRLAVSPEDGHVIATQSRLTVSVGVSGDRLPGTGRLEARTASESLDAQLRFDHEKAEWISGPLFSGISFRVRAGDDRTQWRHVRVVDPPALQRKSAVLTLPPYANSATKDVDEIEGPLRIVEGTAVVISARPIRRGEDPEFRCREGALVCGDERIRLLPGPDGVLHTRTDEPWMPQRNAEPGRRGRQYRISLVDGFGLKSRNEDAITVEVAEDQLPVVNITSPGHDLEVLPTDTVTIQTAARDDLGVRYLKLRHARRRAEDAAAEAPPERERWQHRLLASAEMDAMPLELNGKLTLSIAALGLEPGDLLEYSAVASDFKDDGSLRLSHSPSYRIRVLSEQQHLERIMDALKDLEMEMRTLAARQREESAQAGRLAERAAEAAADADQDARRQVGRDARNAQQREMDESRATLSLADRLAELIPELARNRSTEAGIISRMQQLSAEAGDIARDPITDAARGLGEAAADPQGSDSQAQGSQSQGSQSQGSQSQGSQSQGSQSQGSQSQGSQSQGSQSQGSQSQDSQSQQDQESALEQAEQSAEEAAQRLEDLATRAERMQSESILEQLAAEAERLAARQDEVKESTVPLAQKTIGRQPLELPANLRRALDLVAASEESIADDAEQLAADIAQAADDLAHTDAEGADTARRAAGKMEDDKTADNAAAVAEQLKHNKLLITLPGQQNVIRSLKEVAEILRGPAAQDEATRLAKEIREFIRRQKGINTTIEKNVEAEKPEPPPAAMGRGQSGLKRDVREAASALRWLAQTFDMFESRTAQKLDRAGGEMNSGAIALYASNMPTGLEHGERALRLLEEAAEELEQESSQMAGQGQQQQQEMSEAALLLLRILVDQKKVNQDVGRTDEARPRSHEMFFNRTLDLAERQSELHVMAGRLQEMLAQFQAAADIVDQAGNAMDVARLALDNADTAKDTRVVGRQVVLLLEQFLRSQQGGGGGGGGGGAMQDMMAMMQGRPGAAGGGYHGGTNAPIMPHTLEQGIGDDTWRRAHSLFDGRLGAEAEVQIPPRFRGMLDAYFDQLRRDSMR